MKNSDIGDKPNIELSKIRTLDGKQDKGFEELCVQLLPLLINENLVRVDRIEGSGGDGGVEAIGLTASNQVVGIQSKFFARLDATQWRQIDESVKTAIKNHTALARYIVCVPLDRTPKKIEKWNQLTTAWKALSSNLTVEWNGSSELAGILIRHEASHLLTYWFGCPEFSFEWTARQTALAIAQLHDRYTPTLHQNTTAQVALDFICGSAQAVRAHREACSKVVILWRKLLEKLPSELTRLKVTASIEKLQQAYDKMLADIHFGKLEKQDVLLTQSLAALSELGDKLVNDLFPRDHTGAYDRDQFLAFRQNCDVDSAIEVSNELLDNLKQFIDAQKSSVWILKGKAGSGKSHLMASLAKTLLAQERPCLLIVGERFATQEVLTNQVPALVNWNRPLRELLACLSTLAATAGGTALLMIDAINESPARGLWKRELSQLAALVQDFPKVRLLISCRSDCLEGVVHQAVSTSAHVISHHGFDLQFYDAVKAYFDGYAVTSPQLPTLNSEFRNPLFLKTLCEAYRGQTLPLGPISFIEVLTKWELRIAANIEAAIDCPARVTQSAVNEVVRAMAQSDNKRLDAEVVDLICRRHFSVQEASRSLYRHLNSEGLLQEIEMPVGVQVRLQYERFSDVRVAQVMLQAFQTKKDWLAHWKSHLLPCITVQGKLDYFAAPQLFAYALLLPDAVGIELVACPIATSVSDEWERVQAKQMLWSAWLDALSWRILKPGDMHVTHLFKCWANSQRRPHEVLERLFQFSCVPQHPLNADFLHSILFKQSLPVRESNWTVPLASENLDDLDNGILSSFIHWADASAGKSSKEQARLAATVLLWLTSSPNRELRDMATNIAIRVLVASRSGEICVKLLSSFWTVNDPYVKERLLAVMCGVLPYLASTESKPISEFVLTHFWRQSDIAPHILHRDYAEFIVRHACSSGALPIASLATLNKKVNKLKPEVWTALQVDVYAKNAAYGAIARSLVPEEMGNYGDFGRYVMGSAVHHFLDDERAEEKTFGLGRGDCEHDARFAQRYIWQRVIELGWTPERFTEFERGLGYRGRGRDVAKRERISKKYQWIGLHEYLGLLSDCLLFRTWDEEARFLRGAWELSVRDYDPSRALLSSKTDVVTTGNGLPNWWEFPNPVIGLQTVAQKQVWVRTAFKPFESYLTLQHDNKQWIVLNAHLNFDEVLGFGVEQSKSAQMSQWIDLRVFLIPKAGLEKKLKVLRDKDFFGEGCDIPEAHQCWTSEYPWHPTFLEVDESCRKNDTWMRGLNHRFFLPVCEISNDVVHVQLPAPTLHIGIGAAIGRPLSAPKLNSIGSMEIHDPEGNCVFMGSAQGERVLVVDKACVQQYLKSKGYTLVWAVLSEKSAWDGRKHAGGLSRQSAVYVLEDDGNVVGGMTFNQVEPLIAAVKS